MTGINLKPWEVGAFLAGRKTQLRRVVKPQPPSWIDRYVRSCARAGWIENGPFIRDKGGFLTGQPLEIRQNGRAVKCPFGGPGDVLYGRETWCEMRRHHAPPPVAYRADVKDEAETERCMRELSYKWRSSQTMPEWASRIRLVVESVRVERLHDISEADAAAEGVGRIELQPGPLMQSIGGKMTRGHPMTSTHEHAFRVQWDADHGNGAWARNPWVWVIGVKGAE